MAITLGEIRAYISVDDSGFNQKMIGANSLFEQSRVAATKAMAAFDSIGPSLLKAGAALTAMSAGFGLLLKTGSDLQQELVHVAGNTSMSAAEFDNLQKSVVRLGLTAPVAMDDIGRAYMQASNFGFKFSEANAVVEAGLKSAVATGANAEQTVRALAIAMHQFNIPATEAAKTMDVLHLAAARGGQTLEQFTAVTGRVFSVARAMGVSLVDVSAALSSLTSSGLSAAQSATLLQGAIVKIANPAKGAAEEIARLSKATGIDLVGDFSKAGLTAKGLMGVLDDIAKAVGNDTAEILKLIPAMRGGIGVILLTTTAAKDYKDRLAELNDVMAGKLKPTQQDFERVMKTVGAQATLLQNSFTALGFTLITALGPGLTGGLETLNGVVRQAVGFIGQLPPVIVAATAAFFAAVGAVGTASIALGGLALLLGGPVTVAVIGLGVVVGALAATVALNFGRISAIVTQSTGGVGTSFAVVAAKAGALLDSFQVLALGAIIVFDTIVTDARLMAQGVVGAFQAIKGAANVALALASGDMNAFAAALTDVAVTAGSAFAGIGKTIKDQGARFAEDMKAIGEHAGGKFAKEFALGALVAGESFKRATESSKAAVEESGLKLVNAYIIGINKGKPMSAAAWHAMSDDARAAFTKTAQDAVAAMTKLPEGLDAVADKAAKSMKGLTQGVMNEVQRLSEGLTAAMRDIGEGIDAVFRKNKIDEILVEKIAPAVETLRRKAAELKSEFITAIPAVTSFNNALGAIPAAQLSGGINVLTAKLAALVSAEKVAAAESAGLRDKMIKAFEDVSQKIPGTWNQIINAVAIGRSKTEAEFLKMATGVKGAFADIFGIIGNLPGRVGDVLRKVTGEFDRWVQTINSVLSLLNKAFSSIPASLGDVLSQITGIFKGTVSGISGTVKSVGGSAQEAAKTAISGVGNIGTTAKATSKTFTTAFAAMGGALASFAASAAVVGSGGSKTMGFLTSLVSATGAGVAAGLAFGPLGGAIVGGISLLGGILGMFMGKSPLQKAQEAAALQKAKDDIKLSMQAVLKGAQEVVQSAITSFNMALEFFDRLDNFTEVRKGQFKKFFANLSRLMDGFAEMAKKWSTESLTKAKALAEAMGPVVSVIAAAPAALDGIGQHIGLAEGTIEQFFVDLGTVFDRFDVLAESTTNKMEKQIKKWAERFLPAVDVIAGTIGVLTSMADLKPLQSGVFDDIKAALMTFVTKIGELADFFDKSLLKSIQFFAEKAGPAVELWKNAVDAIKSMAEVPAPSSTAFDILFKGIEAAITGMVELAGRLSTEGLAKAQAIAAASQTIFSAMKTSIESLTALQGYRGVAVETFSVLFADWTKAMDYMQQMSDRAIGFEFQAKLFEGYIKSGSVHLASAFEMLKNIMLAAGSFFPGGSIVVGGESSAAGVSASFVGGNGLASAGGGLSGSSIALSAPSQGRAPGKTELNIKVEVNVHGSLIHQTQVESAVVDAVYRAIRRGRLPQWITMGDLSHSLAVVTDQYG